MKKYKKQLIIVGIIILLIIIGAVTNNQDTIAEKNINNINENNEIVTNNI